MDLIRFTCSCGSVCQLHMLKTGLFGYTIRCSTAPLIMVVSTLQEKPPQPPHHPALLKALAQELQCKPADIVDFELNVCDTVPGTIGGGPPSST